MDSRSGLRVITTCSSRHISWMQSLGADEIINYKHPDAVQQIVQLVQKSGLSLILDCIGNQATAEFCYQCFTPSKDEGNQPTYIYAPLMPILNAPLKSSSLPSSAIIHNKWRFVYTCFGKRFTIIMDNEAVNGTWQPSIEDKRFMVSFYRRVEGLLANDKIQVMPREAKEGGLQSIMDGISLIRAGEVRGKKLVYPIL